jgi:DNA (cytosine-5)-methyltransferase 1
MKYYSSEGNNCAGLADPMPTVTTKDRVGLVTVTVERPDGTSEPAAGVWLKGPDDTERQLYLIADIGLRMLTPRELARAQCFPDSFVLPPQASKAVRLIGNSVPPPLAEAIVRANFPEGVT